GWMLPRYSNAFVPNKRPGSGTELWKTANDTSLEAQVGTRMSKKEKEYGIFLTVSSLLLTVSLHEHSGDWAPRWLWRMLCVGCLGLSFYALRLFCRDQARDCDELRGVTPTDSKKDA